MNDREQLQDIVKRQVREIRGRVSHLNRDE
jgi:hypothetical protein